MEDKEARYIMESYAGRDFDQRRIVTHEPIWEYGGRWSLAEFQKMFADAIASIPKDCLHTAKVTLEDQGYDSGTKFCLSYEGPESEQTLLERIKCCEKYVAERRRQERSTYEALKKKFDVPVKP